MDAIDRRIINTLQGGFPLVEQPYAAAAADLGICETELVRRLANLKTEGVLTRIGPMYRADRMGGGLCLAAMHVPVDQFDDVNQIVNGFSEVAHNYEREHFLNMWFVLATEVEAQLAEVQRELEAATGLDVLLFPKITEYFVGLKLAASSS